MSTAMLILAIPTGMLCAILPTVLYCVLRKTVVGAAVRKRLLEKAIAENHVVEATLVSSKDIYNETRQAVGIYLYTYGGKKYRYRGTSSNTLPESITLYFEENPRKACPENELGFHESAWKRVYFTCSIVLSILVFILIRCFSDL